MPNSLSSDPNASFVGANTVKGAGDVPVAVDNTPTKSVVKSSLVNAATRVENVGSATANVTTLGNPITASTRCTIPLSASIFALVTDDTPLNVTPLEVSIKIDMHLKQK